MVYKCITSDKAGWRPAVQRFGGELRPSGVEIILITSTDVKTAAQPPPPPPQLPHYFERDGIITQKRIRTFLLYRITETKSDPVSAKDG